MAKGKADQSLERRYQRWKDQHGRRWGGNIEISTGHPVGQLEPQFTAPLLPPAKYVRFDDENHGLVIEYDPWIADLTRAKREYVEKGRRYGFEKYGGLFDPNKPFTEEVLLHVGPPPLPVEPVLAAKQGNRWVLGMLGPNGEVPVMPDKLAPFFTKPEVKEEVYEDRYEDQYAAAPTMEPMARRK